MITITEPLPAAAALAHIELLAQAYATSREVVAERVDALNDDVRAVYRRRMPNIKLAVAAATDAQAKLVAEIQAHPELFTKPRTLTLAGIRLGYQKGRGKVEWPEDEKLIATLRKNFSPATVKGLIEIVEKPNRDAIEKLPAHELKKLGVVIVDTGDRVFVKASDTEVDKLVAKILEEGAVAEAEQP